MKFSERGPQAFSDEKIQEEIGKEFPYYLNPIIVGQILRDHISPAGVAILRTKACLRLKEKKFEKN